MGLAYANPPFSLLAKVLTKIAYEGGRVVMCTPDWGCSGEHNYWRRMLVRMTVARVQLPDGPIYVPEDSDPAMQAPEWASFLSIADGSLNHVPLCDLDQVLLKEVMAENRGLTLSDLKNRSSEHLSATLTGCESPDGYLEPATVKEGKQHCARPQKVFLVIIKVCSKHANCCPLNIMDGRCYRQL